MWTSTVPAMKAADVPRVLRGSLAETEAYRDGRKAALAGLARERNPWVEATPAYVTGIGAEADHAVRLVGAVRSVCGASSLCLRDDLRFNPEHSWACKRCRRGVEAERKRLEQGWNRGYRDGMKERG